MDAPRVRHPERCPVCGGEGRTVRTLSRDLIARSLAEFVERELPSQIALPGYVLRMCADCTLEFADPLQPAPGAFYEWLDRERDYYVRSRWEWDRVEALIAERHARQPVQAVLEFGGGDGRFLERVRRCTGARVVTVERSEAFVANLNRQGIEACTDDGAVRALAGQAFDFVLAFHYLEHVPDPVGLARQMCALAGSDGRVLCSVPYSPMCHESLWHDPLNHPPHHLTRWNARSMAALGAAVGRKCALSMPEALPIVARARYALVPRYLGPHWKRHRRRARLLPLLHPVRFLREVVAQALRDRVGGRAAADVMLVELL